MEEVEKKVVAELRAQKVKLWLAPYVNQDQSPSRASLDELSERLTSSLPGCTPKDEIQSALLSLQTHALQKLRQKNHNQSAATSAITTSLSSCFEIKIIGLQNNLGPDTVAPGKWAERIEVKPKALNLFHINPQLVVATFLKELTALLKVSFVKLVHRGTSLSSSDTRLLGQVLDTATTTRCTMLCLVSSSTDNAATQNLSPDQCLVDSIRRAATKLSTKSAFEVTDQHGRHVSMLPTDRLAFLTALGLHSLAKSRMNDTNTLTSALFLLLEADQEWNVVAQEWRDKVDNYGLLQLDIAWIHLKLESLENLEHVTRRLELAEVVLRKQVHTNFVTLALVQADVGNAVPPLAAVFCRLFLLQGVAHYFGGNATKSKERLDWAFTLCSSLRTVSSLESISSLVDAVNISKSKAISALRRSEGNLNQAAELVEKDKTDALEQEERCSMQRELGLVQNNMDHVDLDLLSKLQNVLELREIKVAAGLLRLANNDLEKAIDIYQDEERNTAAVMQRVSDLDCNNQGRRKRSRENQDNGIVVDQVALATLESLGVDESNAKKALAASQNNVEMALLWLTSKDDNETCDAANDDETCNVANEDDEIMDSEEADTSSLDERLGANRHDNRNQESEDAMELLQRELGAVLQEGDLEKEYLGSTLDEEWDFLVKFRGKVD
jgi:NACalpha-BTF3-like transcription factor